MDSFFITTAVCRKAWPPLCRLLRFGLCIFFWEILWFQYHFIFFSSIWFLLFLLFEGTFKFYWIKISVKKNCKKKQNDHRSFMGLTLRHAIFLSYSLSCIRTRFSLSLSLVVLLFSRRDLKYDFSFVTSCLWFFEPWNGSNVEPGETKKNIRKLFRL